jgi:hypothetical protein
MAVTGCYVKSVVLCDWTCSDSLTDPGRGSARGLSAAQGSLPWKAPCFTCNIMPTTSSA